jgi:hypothetical protein
MQWVDNPRLFGYYLGTISYLITGENNEPLTE